MIKGLSTSDLHYALTIIEKAPNVELRVICQHLQIDNRDFMNRLAIAIARLFVEGIETSITAIR